MLITLIFDNQLKRHNQTHRLPMLDGETRDWSIALGRKLKELGGRYEHLEHILDTLPPRNIGSGFLSKIF